VEIEDKIYNRILKLCALGDEKAEEENYNEAITDYLQAYELIPSPKEKWEASTWVLVAIADSHFLKGDFENCLENLRKSSFCPDSIGNPFYHLRKGQCHFEFNELEEATENLLRAYYLEGKEIFEDDDSKYFDFLKSQVRPPIEGW
jgi:tetratricopeptide (TPR) repeat protein